VTVYLVICAVLLYLVKRKVWKKVHAGH